MRSRSPLDIPAPLSVTAKMISLSSTAHWTFTTEPAGEACNAFRMRFESASLTAAVFAPSSSIFAGASISILISRPPASARSSSTTLRATSPAGAGAAAGGSRLANVSICVTVWLKRSVSPTIMFKSRAWTSSRLSSSRMTCAIDLIADSGFLTS